MKKVMIIAMLLVFIFITIILLIYSIINKMNYVDINRSDEALGINVDIAETIEKSYNSEQKERNDIINVLLFGLDTKESNINSRSDTIMIATLDFKNKKVKLSSLMRDMYVNIENHGFTKLNHAYVYGGAPLAIKTVNQNFDTYIKDYFMVDLTSLEKIVDLLGGVKVYIKEEEISQVFSINDNITESGEYLLNGEQAVYYARIRYIGNGDFERTERQRKILSEIYYKTKDMEKPEIFNLLLEILPLVETSMDKQTILNLAIDYFKAGEMTFEQERFPADGYCWGDMSTGIYYLKFETDETKNQLKDYIYKDIKPKEW